MSSKKSAVCYLTRTPDPETVQFAEELARDSRIASNVDIYIMIDDNNYQIQPNTLIKFVQVNNNECISNGYHSSNKLEMNKDCISWDKSLYYFCQVKQNDYSFVWLIEDDTFIPSVNAFFSLHDKYSKEGNGDLICQKNDENLYGNTSGWKWGDVVGKFSPPWYHSMVCAIGCSRKLLDAIANYVKQKRFLPFIEYMFNTVAMQSHLKVVNPPELNTIVFRENWTWDNVHQRPNNWFHPFKNGQVRQEHRLRIANAGQMPAQNAAYTSNTMNAGYGGNTQYQGQMPSQNFRYPSNTGYEASNQYQGQIPSQNVGYPSNTGYEGNTQYQGQMSFQNAGYASNIGYGGNTQCQGQTPQYPNSMPQSHGPPTNSASVLPSIIYSANMAPPYPSSHPPPYPPH